MTKGSRIRYVSGGIQGLDTKGALCSFGEDILTQNLYIYNIYEILFFSISE